MALRLPRRNHECHLVVCRWHPHRSDPPVMGPSFLHYDNRYSLWQATLQTDETRPLPLRQQRRYVKRNLVESYRMSREWWRLGTDL